jgi:hypothetical protein
MYSEEKYKCTRQQSTFVSMQEADFALWWKCQEGEHPAGVLGRPGPGTGERVVQRGAMTSFCLASYAAPWLVANLTKPLLTMVCTMVRIGTLVSF